MHGVVGNVRLFLAARLCTAPCVRMEARGAGAVMGPIQTGLGSMPSPVAGMGEAREPPWTGRRGLAVSAQLLGTRQPRAEGCS